MHHTKHSLELPRHRETWRSALKLMIELEFGRLLVSRLITNTIVIKSVITEEDNNVS